ncbi:hypothetical protein AUV07_15010 [Microbacterium sp. CH1]|nr:hypothetical protein AUV07_15010 [Microbacterium sp. CH1]
MDMQLPLHAHGPSLTSDQARMLDDEFFHSNPLGHFSSKIANLLEAESTSSHPTAESHSEFFDALGVTESEFLIDFDEQERRVQTAIEALALRHQAAEALTRFTYAVAASTPNGRDARCVWLAIADSPTRMIDVLHGNVDALNAEGRFLELFFPPGAVIDQTAIRAADTAIAWLNHAAFLLSDNELSVNAANNKVKHGLAVSARGDVRIEFVTTPPDADGNIPASAFGEGKSVPLFDRAMLTYLCRPHGTPRQGVEAVSLRVDLPIVLAEAWMMANIYAALFASAARRHFGNDLPDGIAEYPRLVVDRLPEHVIGGRVLGFRSPVTTPPDGDTPHRPIGIFFHRRFVPVNVDFENRFTGRVIEG